MSLRGLRGFVTLVALAAAGSLWAFQPIPKESARALGVTRGKPFSAGLVFVNGKYIEPPYVIERWGTGIRVNSIPVTGQVVDWNEFLKTQDGVKLAKQEDARPVPPAVQPAPAVEVKASSLDDLFDDDPKPEKSETKAESEEKAAKTDPVAKPAVQKPTYVLSGEFKHNEASKTLLKRVNASRTEIDRILRTGGFICFGDSYSRVSGDKRTLTAMLKRLPELEQKSESIDDFREGVRSANLIYLNEVLCEDLFRNRVDYRKLKERRKRIESDEQWDKILNDAADPVF